MQFHNLQSWQLKLLKKFGRSEGISSNMQVTQYVDTVVDTSPIQNVRSYSDIYEGCSFALMVADLVSYEEAKYNSEWQKAVIEELSAI